MFSFTKGCKVHTHGTVSQVNKKNIPENRKPQCSLTACLLHAMLWCDLKLSVCRSGSSFLMVVQYFIPRVKLETLPIYLHSQKKSLAINILLHICLYTWDFLCSHFVSLWVIAYKRVRDECKGFQLEFYVCVCVCSRVLLKCKKGQRKRLT